MKIKLLMVLFCSLKLVASQKIERYRLPSGLDLALTICRAFAEESAYVPDSRPKKYAKAGISLGDTVVSKKELPGIVATLFLPEKIDLATARRVASKIIENSSLVE